MTRLKILSIEEEKCIKCEDCVKACSVDLFIVQKEKNNEKKILFTDSYRRCFRCGHCISICPTDAILYEGAEAPFVFDEVNTPEKLLTYEDLMKFIRSRKSFRVFQDKPVPKEKIDLILESMRYSPSASNRQGREYIVITNKKEIATLSRGAAGLLRFARRLMKFKYLLVPFVTGVLRRRLLSPRTKYSLEMFLDKTNKGEDMIFFKAPCVIILHSKKYSRMSPVDSGVAITHGMFAALSLGLKTCWIGLAHEYLSRRKRARKKWGIPSNHDVFGVFVVGYSDLKFKGAPSRRPLKVQWRK